MNIQSLVLRRGLQISGQGRLVHDADGDWFEPPLFEPAIYYPGGPPAPQRSIFAVRVDGADFGRVSRRYERDNCIEGFATVHGVWLDDHIDIERQVVQLDRGGDGRPRWTEPPCPTPPGGWPRVNTYSRNLDFDLGDLEESGLAVSVVTFRPSEEQAVLVVAATDIDAVEAHLRPQLGSALCVVRSRWTKDQIDQVQRHLTNMSRQWLLYLWGPRVEEDAQTTMHASLVRVTPEIAGWVEAQPDGLVMITPWLAPTQVGV